MSWYLNGGVDMSAKQFQTIIGAKGAIVDELVQRDNWATTIGLALGIAAFAYFIVRLVANAISLRQILGHSYALKRHGRVHVVASDRIEVPFTTRGLHRFYVVVPSI